MLLRSGELHLEPIRGERSTLEWVKYQVFTADSRSREQADEKIAAVGAREVPSPESRVDIDNSFEIAKPLDLLKSHINAFICP